MNSLLRASRQLLPAFVAIGLAGVGAGYSQAAHAGPSDSVHTPIVDYREWELELYGGVQDWDNPDLGEQSYKVSAGYGVMRRWATELEVEYSRTPGHVARVEEFEWENRIQLTEHGEHWMDAGVFVEVEHNRLEHKNEIKLGPMLQKEWGRSQLNLNFIAARRINDDINADGAAAARHTGFKYSAQWKYNGNPKFQPGIQAFGSLGNFGALHSDQLRVGPALFGVARLGDGKNLRYNAALLGGMTHATPDTTIRFQLEYEFF